MSIFHDYKISKDFVCLDVLHVALIGMKIARLFLSVPSFFSTRLRL